MKQFKSLSLLFLIAIVIFAAGCGPDRSGPAKPKVISVPAPFNEALIYNDYLRELKNGNTDINYYGLRLAYTKTDKYYPYNFTITDKIQDEAQLLLSNGDTEGALKKITEILNVDYTDLMAHFNASIYYGKLGNSGKSKFHKKIFQELIGSIVSKIMDES